MVQFLVYTVQMESVVDKKCKLNFIYFVVEI